MESDNFKEYRGWRAARDIPLHEAERIISATGYWESARRGPFEKGWFKRIEYKVSEHKRLKSVADKQWWLSLC